MTYNNSRTFNASGGSTYVIEQGVPIPATNMIGNRPRAAFTEALMSLQIGESILAPTNIPVKAVSGYINSAQYHNKTARYAQRTLVSGNGNKAVRIWRIEDRQPKQDTNG